MKIRQASSAYVGASVALTFSILAACTGSVTPPTILASSYDRSCSKASDCVPVFSGTLTCCTSCDNAAINRSDLAKYNAARAAEPDECTGVTACPAIACLTPDVACVAGTCALSNGAPDAGADSGKDSGKPEGGSGSCTSDTDCGKGSVCGFAEEDACTAKGSCFPAPQAICDAYEPGCACDGSTISVICTGLPSGYVSKPLAHAGACSEADGGRCCPVGWDMHDCTFADGGSDGGGGGLACHNPAEACASSLTCGQGCDFIVDGRCAGDGG